MRHRIKHDVNSNIFIFDKFVPNLDASYIMVHNSRTFQNHGQSGHGGHGTYMHNSGTFQNHGQSGHGGHGTSAIGNAWRHVVNSFKNPTWKDYSKYH
jgi:hypothetical protein